jgi:hypothetical protein
MRQGRQRTGDAHEGDGCRYLVEAFLELEATVLVISAHACLWDNSHFQQISWTPVNVGAHPSAI